MKLMTVVSVITALVTCIVAFFPIYWMIYSSVLPVRLQFSWPPILIPTDLRLDNYVTVLKERPVLTWLANTATVSILTTLLSMPPSVLAAYAFYRFRFRARRVLFRLLFVLMIVPASTMIIPYYSILSSWHMTNSLLGLAISYLIFTLPINVVLFYSYLFSIPPEIEEAALLDGCTVLTSFVRIVLPLALSGIAVISIIDFTLGWSEFMFAVTLISSPSKYTAVYGLYTFLGEFSSDWGAALASATYFAIPALIFYFVTQKYLVKGMTAGAVKGA